MTDTDDLRDKLALCLDRRDRVEIVDALMPVVRAALADAFDRGWEESAEGYNHEWPPGDQIPYDRPPNPWREDDRG